MASTTLAATSKDRGAIAIFIPTFFRQMNSICTSACSWGLTN